MNDPDLQDAQTLAVLLAEALEIAETSERREALEALVESLNGESTSILEDTLNVVI